jgi:hypothetical protein
MVTVEDMNKTSPTLIRALERERLLKEQAEVRSRFTEQVKDENKRSPLIAVSDGAVREAMPPRSAQTVDAVATFTLHVGRLCLRDASRALGWTDKTPLAFSTSPFGITVTSCGFGEARSTFMDTQQRVVVPVAARNRFELRNGESVLIVTAKEPIAHVRIIPMALVLAGLTELETKS